MFTDRTTAMFLAQLVKRVTLQPEGASVEVDMAFLGRTLSEIRIAAPTD